MSIQEAKAPSIIIFDIETVAQDEETLLSSLPPFDPAEVKMGNIKDPAKQAEKLAQAEQRHKADYLAKAALSPVTGKVAAIGHIQQLGDKGDIISTFLATDPGLDETALLKGFWGFWLHTFNSSQDIWVGHNILDFDLPFLVNRSRILGIPVPPFVYSFRNHRVNWSDRFLDTRTVWLMGRKPTETPSSLDHICKALGLGQKAGSGAEFGKMLAEDPVKAREYLKQDLLLTAQLASRLNII